MPATPDYAASFSLVDADGSGLISPRELVGLMDALGEPCDLSRAEEVVRTMDGDGDGRISLDEFSRFMASRGA